LNIYCFIPHSLKVNIKYSATHKTFIGGKAASFIHEINQEALSDAERRGKTVDDEKSPSASLNFHGSVMRT
jgi:hypothetical protein